MNLLSFVQTSIVQVLNPVSTVVEPLGVVSLKIEDSTSNVSSLSFLISTGGLQDFIDSLTDLRDKVLSTPSYNVVPVEPVVESGG